MDIRGKVVLLYGRRSLSGRYLGWYGEQILFGGFGGDGM